MEEKLRVRRPTRSSPILAGLPPNVVSVESSLVSMKCKFCGTIFQRRTAYARWQFLNLGIIPLCTKSCKVRQQFIDNPELRKISSQTMKRIGRPGWNRGMPWPEEFRAASSKLRKKRGIKISPENRGGNGRGLTQMEKLLQTVLPITFIPNYAISLGKRQPGYPTNYKVDFGDPDTLMAIEVDGGSHYGRKAQDRKKDAKLTGLGWSVLRITNQQVAAMFGILRSRAGAYTLSEGLSSIT